MPLFRGIGRKFFLYFFFRLLKKEYFTDYPNIRHENRIFGLVLMHFIRILSGSKKLVSDARLACGPRIPIFSPGSFIIVSGEEIKCNGGGQENYMVLSEVLWVVVW